MGSVPLKPAELTNASLLGIHDPNKMKVSSPDKEDVTVPKTNGSANGSTSNIAGQALAAPASEISAQVTEVSAAINANGSRKIPFADESTEHELPPAKKQKHESLSMDVSFEKVDSAATSSFASKEDAKSDEKLKQESSSMNISPYANSGATSASKKDPNSDEKLKQESLSIDVSADTADAADSGAAPASEKDANSDETLKRESSSIDVLAGASDSGVASAPEKYPNSDDKPKQESSSMNGLADTADSSAASAPKKDANSDEKQKQESSLIHASADTTDSGVTSTSKKDANSDEKLKQESASMDVSASAADSGVNSALKKDAKSDENQEQESSLIHASADTVDSGTASAPNKGANSDDKPKQESSSIDVSADTADSGAASAPKKDPNSDEKRNQESPSMDVSADTADSSAASAPKKDSNSDEKQEQKSSLIDASPDTADSGAASASEKDASEPVGITPVSDDAITALVTAPATATAPDATVPAITTATRSAPDYSAIIHPSIAEIIRLEELPAVKPLESLTLREMAELEAALQIGDTCNYSDEDAWKPDWGGNLLLYEKDVVVNKGYLINQPNAKPAKVKYCDWVASNAPGSNGLRGLELLLRFVYNMKGTPAMAKKILAHSLQRPAKSAEHRLEFIVDAISRVSYDPAVLQQDGWTIKKVDTPQEGEAFHIGRRIMWQRHEAIIIAFTPDETYGGLWKAAYVEDLETFDLEPGELQAAIKKWDNKQKQLSKKRNAVRAPPPPPSGSTRFAATANFTVDGIENGIILAVPTSRAAQGVLWPARVRHVVEGSLTASGGVRRNSSKNMIQVVFLAPFWNGQSLSSKVSNAKDPYSLGPLFEFDNIEVSEYNLQKYPFETISMEKIKGSFLFLSLPKGVFSRYLDSHRLAVALKTYAIKTISSDHASRSDDQVLASAQLIESHGLSLRTPIFPQVALTVPFEFILSKLPHPSEFASMTDDDDNDAEPAIDIDAIIRSMSPPHIFGKKLPSLKRDTSLLTPECKKKSFMSPDPHFTPAINIAPHEEEEEALWSTNKFASDFLCGIFQTHSSGNNLSIDGLAYMEKLLTSLIAKLRQLSNVFTGYGASKQSAELRSILCQCLLIKGHGEDSLEFGTIPAGVSKATIISEWRKACERIYKRAVSKLSSKGVGNDITSVITDSRCNGHVTQSGSFERPVRIPAAIKGARLAGAGIDPNVLLVTQVENPYLEIAENVVIPKAHKLSYIKRLKTKIASIQPNETGVPLTDDSEGEGGEDTMGSRGSYTAAIVGVAASIKAADMVVGGQCVNVFCAVRPPGHHAGQELRSMKAISNGFCLFNSAACAALYATTPRSQGGLGLRRVCIIDFDVHHGNGTQDILCPTFDPRFLYVSLHAGGAHINGYDDEDSDAESFRLKLGGKKQEGIFPGRCGDTSPHEGVLNIPLGQKVTASAMGTALVSQVTPAVEVFSPDLIILSAGFDAHMNDPLGMGGLTAEDFGSVTEVACQMAYKTCSGRIFSVLEGGYGVPCCQPRDDLFLPPSTEDRLLQLGSDLPANMKDDVPFTFRQKLDRCHAEGFLECVKEHVKGFVKCNKRK